MPASKTTTIPMGFVAQAAQWLSFEVDARIVLGDAAFSPTNEKSAIPSCVRDVSLVWIVK